MREAVERSVDSVQLIHDQTLRLIASGLGPREAAETLYMPRRLREGREGYGQVESHVRQVYNGNLGWFDGDVYEINPLSVREEAERTVQAMGGRAAVQKMATQAVADGGFANWRWGLKLTSLLLKLDPADAAARKTRATAARALGQRTDSANARGFYITEALQMEGKLLMQGQPVTLDAIRTFLSTPRAERSGGRLRRPEPAVRPLPRRSAQGRGPAAGLHPRSRGRPADQAGRTAQQRARDLPGRLPGRASRRRDAERAGGFRARQGRAGEGRRTRWPSWIACWIEAGCCRRRRPSRRCSMRKAT